MSFMAAKKMLLSGARPLRPQDVFATSLYTGNGGTQTVTNGLELAGNDGLVWIKARDSATDHYLYDRKRGVKTSLKTNTTDAEVNAGAGDGLSQFSSGGFSVQGSFGRVNASGTTYAAWSFRQADKFFAIRLIQHTTGTASTISLPSFGPIGMVIGKNRSASGNWPVWHRSLLAGQGLRLNLVNAAGTTQPAIDVSGQTITLSAPAPSGNYVLYIFAHNPDLIDCGIFNHASASAGTTVTCGNGWKPQFALIKQSEASGDWGIYDTQRGWNPGSARDDALLRPNLGAAEELAQQGFPTETGFNFSSAVTGSRIFLAIRSPT